MKLKNYFAGKWQEPTSTETITAVDPRTEKTLAVLPAGNAADADAAVMAALAAQPEWAALTLEQRVAKLTRFIDHVEADRKELASLESKEMGKPLELAQTFLSMAIAGFRGSLEDAKKYEFRKEISGANGVTKIIRQPLGVAALIVPWNFPMASTLGALVTILVSGNTVVLKPSEKSALSAVRLFAANTLPAGVFNLLLGDVRAGAPLASHKNVNLVHFTGSVEAGKSVAQSAAKNLTRAVIELGGKDAAVIDNDIDVERVAETVAVGAFTNSGQICTAFERVYVHKNVAAPFLEALKAQAQKYCEIGPLVDAQQRETVVQHVQDAVEKGAKIVFGGSLPGGRGFFYPPTILTDVNSSMKIMNDETFGPVVAVEVINEFADGIKKAGNTRYGLAGSVFTTNKKSMELAEKMRVGLVSINEWLGGDGVGVFEPYGDSGLGVIGSAADFEAATRPMSVFKPH